MKKLILDITGVCMMIVALFGAVESAERIADNSSILMNFSTLEISCIVFGAVDGAMFLPVLPTGLAWVGYIVGFISELFIALASWNLSPDAITTGGVIAGLVTGVCGASLACTFSMEVNA